MKRTKAAVAVAIVGALAFVGGTAWSNGPWRLQSDEVRYNIPPTADGGVNPDPFLANGVTTGWKVPVYSAAGTGPAGRNTLAPSGTPARYIDYDVLAQAYPGFAPTDADKAAGVLPAGVTITEAQGLSTLARVQENLVSAGLTLRDITFMRIYVDNPAGATIADYAGWNRSYRKFVANVDLTTGETIDAYEPVVFSNKTRPARTNIEVATLPVAGWLIEIEVVAAVT